MPIKGYKQTREHRLLLKKNHRGFLGLIHSLKTKNILSEQRKEGKSVNWLGNDASYSSKHKWIRKYYGNPISCEDCGLEGRKVGRKWNIDWSNIDHMYRREREDYNGRCKKCHSIYDFKNNLIK